MRWLAMPAALTPAEIFDRAAAEGERRLDQNMLELLATGFIAGFTVVFGIAIMGIVEWFGRPQLADLSRVAGALAFAPAVVFLVVGRAELFSENFFDPIAAWFRFPEKQVAARLFRLWVVTLVLNLVGGMLMVLLFSVEGSLPPGASDSFNRIAEEIVDRRVVDTFARAIAGGALVALLSFFVAAADSTAARILLAYMVGVVLALGSFDHVVVSALNLGFGLVLGASIQPVAVAMTFGITILGNLLGGIGLVTLSHAAQAQDARRRDRD